MNCYTHTVLIFEENPQNMMKIQNVENVNSCQMNNLELAPFKIHAKNVLREKQYYF